MTSGINQNQTAVFNNFYSAKTQSPQAFSSVQTQPVLNETKTDTFENSSTAAIAENPSKNNKAKIIIGAVAAAAALAIGGIFLHKKMNAADAVDKIKKVLPEHIDFTPAKNVKEAEKFGQEVLGIKNYVGFESKDTNVLNWINEGFVNVNNTAKGKAKMPETVLYDEKVFSKLDGALAVAVSSSVMEKYKYNNRLGSSILAVNKKWFDNPVESLKHRIDKNIKGGFLKKTENGYGLCNLFVKDDSLLEQLSKLEKGELNNFNEQILLFDTLGKYHTSLTSVVNSPLNTYKQLVSDEDAIKAFKNLSYDKQRSAIIDAINSHNFDVKISVYHPNTPFSTIYHEMGHLQDTVERVPAKEKFKNPDEYPAALKEWLENSSNIDAANSISLYAASGPGEFIAETFAKIVNGSKIPDEAKELYLKLNGPSMIL